MNKRIERLKAKIWLLNTILLFSVPGLMMSTVVLFSVPMESKMWWFVIEAAFITLTMFSLGLYLRRHKQLIVMLRGE